MDHNFRDTGRSNYLHVRIGGVFDDSGEGFGDVVPVALVREQPILGHPVLGLGLPSDPHDGCQKARPGSKAEGDGRSMYPSDFSGL